MVCYSLDRERTRQQSGQDFQSVGEPSAVMWWIYRERLLEVEKVMKIGDMITPRLAKELGIKYWLVGNNNLRDDQLQLKRLDLHALGVVSYPGKSVHINFGPEDGEVSKSIVCRAMLGREPVRQDRVWEADPEVLDRKGFVGFWAPTHSAPLHVRLVWRWHFDNQGDKIDPGHLRDLQRSFRRLCCK